MSFKAKCPSCKTKLVMEECYNCHAKPGLFGSPLVKREDRYGRKGIYCKKCTIGFFDTVTCDCGCIIPIKKFLGWF